MNNPLDMGIELFYSMCIKWSKAPTDNENETKTETTS